MYLIRFNNFLFRWGSWFITPITLVYGTSNYSYWGESKPTNITGGPHPVVIQCPSLHPLSQGWLRMDRRSRGAVWELSVDHFHPPRKTCCFRRESCDDPCFFVFVPYFQTNLWKVGSHTFNDSTTRLLEATHCTIHSPRGNQLPNQHWVSLCERLVRRVDFEPMVFPVRYPLVN